MKILPICLIAFAFALPARSADDKPDASKMPHMTVDVQKKLIRVEAEVIRPDMPLEFFCCMTGTAEHEAVLRSAVKPSNLHLGLLMLGAKPGEPVRFVKAAEKWMPPHGHPIHIFVEWEGKDKQMVRYPAYRMMRNVKTKKEMPPMTWIFAGSRMMDDGKYAADVTGYIVSVVNFDLTLIDIPDLASNANDSLEWEYNPDLCPERGAKVWMIIEPAGKDEKAPEKPAGNEAPAKQDDPKLSDVTADEQKIKSLRAKWEEIVKPRGDALKKAAQAHYDVIGQLRKEQNRLIDEADRIQRVIDQLQKEYQDLTTPRPEN